MLLNRRSFLLSLIGAGVALKTNILILTNQILGGISTYTTLTVTAAANIVNLTATGLTNLARTILRNDPSTSPVGTSPGLKISINNHGDALQPAVGDFVGLVSYIDDQNSRTRIWAENAAISVYSMPTTTSGIVAEFDINNLSSSDPVAPGAGTPALLGVLIAGGVSGGSTKCGSAGLLITAVPGTWIDGIFIDSSDCGIRMGGTFVNGLGIDLAQSRMRLSAFSATPAHPPANNVDIYAQLTGGGKVQLVAQFPSGIAQIIATEP